MVVDGLCYEVKRNLTKAEWDEFVGTGEYECTCPALEPGEGADSCGETSKP